MLDTRFEVLDRVGEGGMAVVYRGHDRDAGLVRALKVLAPALVGETGAAERLRREAELAKRLSHPNCCPILHVGETADGFLYLVMPYLEGESLATALDRLGAFSPSAGVPLLVDIARGLAHAHGLDILHRDLKPENVMLVADPNRPAERRAVVMDFGLAKHLKAGPELLKLTATGIVLGTPEFMSPEQVRGQPLDARSDLFALGVLAFELFTDELPFEGRSPQELMIARLTGLARPVRRVRPAFPAPLATVIDRCLAQNPDDRYPSLEAFIAALEHAGAEGHAR